MDKLGAFRNFRVPLFKPLNIAVQGDAMAAWIGWHG